MAVKGIAFTMYPVANMQRAVTFYHDVLGLPMGELSSENWTEFDLAGGTFGVGTFEQLGVPGTAQSLAIEVADLTEFRSMLTARGITSNEPFETPVCFISGIADPDGNKIVLHQQKAK